MLCNSARLFLFVGNIFLTVMVWTVVKFICSEEVEVLPINWLTQDRQQCFYPSYPRQKLEKAIRNKENPLDSWIKYDVKVLSVHSYDNFSIATAKASKACYTSDIDVENQSLTLPAKRPVRKNKIYSSDEEQESDRSLEGIPSIATGVREYRQLNTNKEELNRLENRNKQDMSSQQDLGSDYMNTNGDNSTQCFEALATNHFDASPIMKVLVSNQVKQKKILDEVTRNLDKVILVIQQNSDTLAKILDTLAGKVIDEGNTRDNFDVYDKLPIKTEQEFNEVEEMLSESRNFDSLVKSLCRIGGNDYKEVIRRILTKLMNDTFMNLYSYHGHKGKKIFAKTKLCAAMIEAVKYSDDKVTIKEIEVKASACLAKASERLKRH